MRHRQTTPKIGSDASHRKSMTRNLITSLVLHEGIETTITKAKAIQPQFDKMMTFVLKNDTKTAIQRVNKIVFTEDAARKVIGELKDRFKERNSGFTRIIRTKERVGDNAQMVKIELV
jgi:large subunit ribosomal protein L17